MSQLTAAWRNAAISVSLVLFATACTDNGREPKLSRIETVPPADVETRLNFNIDNPTLVVADNFEVSPGDTLTLVWSDEFNGSQLDPETWLFEIGDGSGFVGDGGIMGLPRGWGNNELQYYLPDSARLEDGLLKITARREVVSDPVQNFNYTSARITTRDRFAFKYGRIEASIKLPAGQGLWPAFWLLSQGSPYGSWAATGEIDVMEAVNLGGTGGNEIFGTIHYGGIFPANQFTSIEYTPDENVTEDFHTYAVEWDATEIRWYFDDFQYATQNNWFSDGGDYPAPFDQPFYVLFNLAVGGNLPGSPNGSTPFPATMEVDWVRVYTGEDSYVPADPGTLPDDAVYASDPAVPEDLAPPGGLQDFGSGSVFNADFTADRDFSPVLAVTSGDAYDPGNVQVGFAAFTGYMGGFAAEYETIDFKVKGLPSGEIEVKFFGGDGGDGSADNALVVNVTTYAGSTELGNGWYEVSVPLSEFSDTIDINEGFLLGPPGDQGAQFTFFLTDIGFSGSSGGGPADPGIVPEFVIFATDPGVVEDLAPPATDNFGSGAVFDFEFAGDADFNPALQVTSGEGYGAGVHVGFIALTGYAPGFAAGYETLNFKVKGNAANLDSFEVKFIEGGDTSVLYDLTTYSGVTDLGNGWLQVSIPMTDFAATIDVNQGLLLGPAGDQGAAFSFLMTDIGFTGTTGGGGGSGITPEAVVYATDPGLTEDLAPPATDNFGSGAVFDFEFAGDADFNPALQVTSGEGYGAGVHVGFVAFNGYAEGFASSYEDFVFKVKGDAGNLDDFEVKFINNGDTSVRYDLTTYGGVTDLGNGWQQVSVPMSDFAATIDVNSGFLLGPFDNQGAPFSYLLTDIGFTGSAGGGGGGGGGSGGLAVNGGFEGAFDNGEPSIDGWEVFTNGGTVEVVTTDANSGSNSARLVSSTLQNPLIKQFELAQGTVNPGDPVNIEFWVKGSAADGGVVFAEFFSEAADGATNEILGGGPLALNADWTQYTFTATAGADVTRGISLQIAAVCGGAATCSVDIFVDDVSIFIGSGG